MPPKDKEDDVIGIEIYSSVLYIRTDNHSFDKCGTEMGQGQGSRGCQKNERGRRGRHHYQAIVSDLDTKYSFWVATRQ